MAGTPQPEETPKLGWKATAAGLVFALAVLSGFAAATAVSYEDNQGHDDHGEEHSDDEEHGEDDHADDGGDDH